MKTRIICVPTRYQRHGPMFFLVKSVLAGAKFYKVPMNEFFLEILQGEGYHDNFNYLTQPCPDLRILFHDLFEHH